MPSEQAMKAALKFLESLPFPERVPQWGIPDWQMAVEKAKEQARTALAEEEVMADNEQIRQQNEINRATGQGHDATKRETAGMIEKLREALRKYGDHTVGCDYGHHDAKCVCGWNAIRFTLAESEPPQQPVTKVPWSDAPDLGPPAGSVQTDADTPKPTVTVPQQPGSSHTAMNAERAWCCPRCHGKSYIIVNGVEVCGVCQPTGEPGEVMPPPTTPEEANDILASVGLLPQRLSPPEIARRIVAPWTVYGNVRIDGKVIERAIIAVIEKERAAKPTLGDFARATVADHKEYKERIAELEAKLKKAEDWNTYVHGEAFQLRQLLQPGYREDKTHTIDHIIVVFGEAKELQGRIAELEDDLKLQRQANKFNYDEYVQEVAELKRQREEYKTLFTSQVKHCDSLNQCIAELRWDKWRVRPDEDGEGGETWAKAYSDCDMQRMELKRQLAEEAKADVETQEILGKYMDDLAPSPCGHRQADLVERRKATLLRRTTKHSCWSEPHDCPRIHPGKLTKRTGLDRRIGNLGPPCGRCEEIKAVQKKPYELGLETGLVNTDIRGKK